MARRHVSPYLKLLNRFAIGACGICGRQGVRIGHVTCIRCHQNAYPPHHDTQARKDASQAVRQTQRRTGQRGQR